MTMLFRPLRRSAILLTLVMLLGACALRTTQSARHLGAVEELR